MDIIKVENIRLYAYHGCLPEERQIGSDYRIAVTVKADLRDSAETDALSDTVDYVIIYQIVVEEMQIPANLLEQIVQRIINRILLLNKVEKATVSVTKINPPIGGDVAGVSVEMTREKDLTHEK